MDIIKGIEIALLALLPSLIWLTFYLRRDHHPEPRRLLVTVFLLGFIVTPFVGWFELCLNNPLSAMLNVVVTQASPLCHNIGLPPLIAGVQNSVLGWFIFFIFVALIEETAKYLVVRFSVVQNREFDEPVDAMVYLICAALGFAASENVFAALNIAASTHILSASATLPFNSSLLTILGLRFIGATLLHTLSSGVLGFWLARGYFHTNGGRYTKRHVLIHGLLLATIIHASFNLFINLSNNLTQPIFVILTLGLLLLGLVAVLTDFKRIQNTLFVIR